MRRRTRVFVGELARNVRHGEHALELAFRGVLVFAQMQTVGHPIQRPNRVAAARRSSG
jgi:hypothetical protein